MRKLLLTSSALVAAASISSYAVADVSVTGDFEWAYKSTSSGVATTDGDSFTTDNEIAINFSNKTDNGLTIGGKVELDIETAETKGDEEPVQREIVDIAALLSTGDLAHGEKVFKKCSACHSIKSGGGNKIGPALYNVVGRKVGILDDYKYSKALAKYEKNWSFEELNGFLLKPKDWIKGTKMAYAGLRKEKDRASVILYLNKYSDSPLPLP